MKYLIAIPCVNRAEKGATQVIEDTFRSFEKSGMFESSISFKILLLESGSKDRSYLDFVKTYQDKYNKDINILFSDIPLNGTTNTLRMFQFLKNMKKPFFDYVLWMDDDVWVCKNFIENADIWIRRYAKNTLFNSLYVPYPTFKSSLKHPYRHIAQIGAFIGTCCTVFRPIIAKHVVKHWYTSYFNEFQYNPDVRFRESLRIEFPHIKGFYVSYPSLVEHMNIGSTIRKNGQKGHKSIFFPGEDFDPDYKNKISP